MTNPDIRAFLLGRAMADLLRERVEGGLTDLASWLGKSVAEAQEGIRTFPEDVIARAEQERTQLEGSEPSLTALPMDDLQATLDDLRAEVAQLRSELKKYRSQST